MEKFFPSVSQPLPIGLHKTSAQSSAGPAALAHSQSPFRRCRDFALRILPRVCHYRCSAAT